MTRLSTRDRPVLNLRGAFVRRTDLSNADLRDAELSGADASNALFRRSNFQGARLVGTILRGADLTGATNLTVEQLARAVIDEHTLLPDYIDRSRLHDAAKPFVEAAS
ncbi:pentapeptide repeat-containing protein [uncultured Methylobacterium sp.]|uniref:pentapeptide repeat-containing protein n=1 Tax=uncultured Methylobacterium sp. TaxID=157278 RepID=UPI0035CA4185